MSYVGKHLIETETVAYVARLHWIVLVWPVLLGLLIGVAGLASLIGSVGGPPPSFDPGDTEISGASTLAIAGGSVLLVLAGACITAGVLKRNATEMILTDKRVIVNVGVMTRNTSELILQKVENIGVEESVMGRILGYGTVVVREIGGTRRPFDNVAHPNEFRKQVEQQIEKSLERSR